MRIEPPKTIEDFEKVLASIMELQANPWCDHLMFMDLCGRRDNVYAKIAELKSKQIKT